MTKSEKRILARTVNKISLDHRYLKKKTFYPAAILKLSLL